VDKSNSKDLTEVLELFDAKEVGIDEDYLKDDSISQRNLDRALPAWHTP